MLRSCGSRYSCSKPTAPPPHCREPRSSSPGLVDRRRRLLGWCQRIRSILFLLSNVVIVVVLLAAETEARPHPSGWWRPTGFTATSGVTPMSSKGPCNPSASGAHAIAQVRAVPRAMRAPPGEASRRRPTTTTTTKLLQRLLFLLQLLGCGRGNGSLRPLRTSSSSPYSKVGVGGTSSSVRGGLPFAQHRRWVPRDFLLLPLLPPSRLPHLGGCRAAAPSPVTRGRKAPASSSLAANASVAVAIMEDSRSVWPPEGSSSSLSSTSSISSSLSTPSQS